VTAEIGFVQSQPTGISLDDAGNALIGQPLTQDSIIATNCRHAVTLASISEDAQRTGISHHPGSGGAMISRLARAFTRKAIE
jgi:hypothetical protein